MYSGASNFVEGVDTAFVIILGIAIFFLVALTGLMLYFIWRYNNKRHKNAVQIEGNTTLEMIWTIIPAILVLFMFYVGWRGWAPMKDIPDDAMEVTAVARMWNFTYVYENGKTADKLYLPVNKPVKIKLEALDVIHSLYIPAFRVKEDMVPGYDKTTWFIPQQEGTYDLFCAEYCGLRHSYMYSDVVVMSDTAFNTWYSDTTGVQQTTSDPTGNPALMGRTLIESKGCIACHSIDGSKLVGPTFLGLLGRDEIVITNGKERRITVDEQYIRTSIYNPAADIVQGYRKGQMVAYPDITEQGIEQITTFIKSLNDE